MVLGRIKFTSKKYFRSEFVKKVGDYFRYRLSSEWSGPPDVAELQRVWRYGGTMDAHCFRTDARVFISSTSRVPAAMPVIDRTRKTR